MAAIEAISKTRLPADMKDRDRLGNGHAGNGQGGPVTSPLPKKTIDYHLPAGISLDEAQGAPRAQARRGTRNHSRA
jgi:hypothetical protein